MAITIENGISMGGGISISPPWPPTWLQAYSATAPTFTGRIVLVNALESIYNAGSTTMQSSYIRTQITPTATWTSYTTTPATSAQFIAVASSGSVIMAISTTGQVVTTTDSVTWSTATSLPTLNPSANNAWRFLAYANGTWVAQPGYSNTGTFTPSGQIAYSTNNGSSWTSSTSAVTASNWNGLTGAGNNFTMYSQDGHTAYSTNGSSWTNVAPASSGWPAGIGPYSTPVWTGSQWYMAWSQGTTDQMSYLTSSNGGTWTGGTMTVTGMSSSSTPTLAYGNSTYVIVDPIHKGTCWTSSNGTTWTANPNAFNYNATWDVPLGYSMFNLIYTNGMFVYYFTAYNSGYVGVVYTSTNGLKWAENTTAPSYGSPWIYAGGGDTNQVIFGLNS